MTDSRIMQLAQAILANTTQVDQSMKAAGQLELTLGLNNPEVIPPEDGAAQMSKNIAIGAAQELIALLGGPMGTIQNLATYEYDIAALYVIHKFQIAKAFPLGGTVSYEDLAKRTGLSVKYLTRILKYSMTGGIFLETPSGEVMHTALSRALAEDAGVMAEAAQLTDEQFGAAAHMAQAIEKYGNSDKPTHTGWSLANNACSPMFAELRDNHPARAIQFSRFMDLWAIQHPTAPLIHGYDWISLSPNAHIVDVGGGEGNVSKALSMSFPSFRFTVQDLEPTISSGRAKLPNLLKERITFQVHDFMGTTQSVKDADVYFFRSIFHDWPDKQCVKILQNTIPALKPGAKIVLNELCIDHAGFAPPIQRIVRGLDLVMLSLFNGRERSEEDFRGIFAAADPRFKFVGAKLPTINEMGIPEKGLLSIIEARWEP